MVRESNGLEKFVIGFFAGVIFLLLGAVTVLSTVVINELQDQKPLKTYSGQLLIVDRDAVSKDEAILPWDEHYKIQGEAPGGARQWFTVSRGDYYRLQGENFTCSFKGEIIYSC